MRREVFGKKMRKLLDEAYTSANTLASLAGISRHTLQHVTSKRYSKRYSNHQETAARLADALDSRADELKDVASRMRALAGEPLD